jgi:hypothetical protein
LIPILPGKLDRSAVTLSRCEVISGQIYSTAGLASEDDNWTRRRHVPVLAAADVPETQALWHARLRPDLLGRVGAILADPIATESGAGAAFQARRRGSRMCRTQQQVS